MNRGARRQYQKVAIAVARRVRAAVLFWARQCRKSTTLGDISFDQMSAEPGRTVIAASASLLMGTELVSKTLSATEQALLVTREAAAVQTTLTESAAGGALQFKCADAETGKVYQGISGDDFADLYRSSRLEMRLYFTRTSYSRTLVIAPNPATARGWTGTVLRDEAGFTRSELERELQIAVKPIVDTDPTFKLLYASNLPRDDRHPFFEMTLPEPGAEFPPKADGHFYRGQNGLLIHRVSLADAYAAGHQLYDMQEGKPMTYGQFCADPANKLGLNESYRLIHEMGGSAAIDLLALTTAQRRGIGQCTCAIIDNDRDFEHALQFLREKLTDGAVGIGVDPATTTGDTSNPTSVTVSERRGIERYQRVVFIWKVYHPRVARERFKRIVQTVGARPAGGPVRRLCIEATSEQYFARDTADELRDLVPVEQVDVRNIVKPVPAGYQRQPNYKTWLGDLYSTAVNDNRYVAPPETYFKDDHRLVVKTGGTYQCEPQADGKHGDTFSSGQLAEYALEGSPAGYYAEVI